MEFVIRFMTEADWPQVKEIYQQGIDGGNSTFAKDPPQTWQAWCASKAEEFSFVAADGESLLGWVTLSPTSKRDFYRGVMEVSLYIAESAKGKGVGQALLQHLIQYSEANNVWSLTALIFPENEASMHLHQKLGFKVQCIRERLGFMTFGPYAGRWRDVAFLERRSSVAGK
jgi:phosphinothricin acetyltransferase